MWVSTHKLEQRARPRCRALSQPHEAGAVGERGKPPSPGAADNEVTVPGWTPHDHGPAPRPGPARVQRGVWERGGGSPLRCSSSRHKHRRASSLPSILPEAAKGTGSRTAMETEKEVAGL